MRLIRSSFVLWLFSVLLPFRAVAQEQPALALRDGDRVAFIGDTLIEREQYSGWIELLLTARFADRNERARCGKQSKKN